MKLSNKEFKFLILAILVFFLIDVIFQSLVLYTAYFIPSDCGGMECFGPGFPVLLIALLSWPIYHILITIVVSLWTRSWKIFFFLAAIQTISLVSFTVLGEYIYFPLVQGKIVSGLVAQIINLLPYHGVYLLAVIIAVIFKNKNEIEAE